MGSQTPYAPHTGIDLVSSAGDTSESNGALGALAALAVGAAGIGITKLASDRDDDDDEKKGRSENVEVIDNGAQATDASALQGAEPLTPSADPFGPSTSQYSQPEPSGPSNDIFGNPMGSSSSQRIRRTGHSKSGKTCFAVMIACQFMPGGQTGKAQ